MRSYQNELNLSKEVRMKRNMILCIMISLFMVAVLSPFFLGGCFDSSPSVPDTTFVNLVFTGAAEIRIGSPKSGDTVSTTPDFSWQSTGNWNVFAAVFTKKISVNNSRNSISNINDNVWAWHSGLGTGREGNISYSDGRSVVNGVLQTGLTPTPLKTDSTYFWAVWAWSNDGTRITYSSKESFFRVR